MTPVAETMDGLLTHWATTTPDAEAAIENGAGIDFASLETRVNGLARWLDGQGIAKGARVAVAAAPGLTCLIALLAISRVGAIYVGVSPRYTATEIVHVVSLTTPDCVIVDLSQDLDLGIRIAAAAPDLRMVEAKTPDSLPQMDGEPMQSRAQAGDVAVIVFTSGSTGKPKGAALHHGGLIAAAQAQANLSDVWADGAQARYLSNLPMNHVGGIMNLTLAALVNGGALIFQAKFDPADTLRLLAEARITSWLQVPAMFTLCAQHPDFATTKLPDLRTIGIGGGPVSVKTLAALRSLDADIFVEYGQTETMSSLTFSDKTDSDEVLLTTVGRFDTNIDARIADTKGHPVAQGEVGEVQARGNCTLRSYWGDDVATQEAFTKDGWLHTGDLAIQCPDGRLVLVGRAREMIKSGGFNVYPREVEQALEQHPAVAEVVVFGATDDVYVERVEAAIELRAGATAPDTKALQEMCRADLAGYKIPRAFHLHTALPRLPNGKVDRAAVKRGHQ